MKFKDWIRNKEEIAISTDINEEDSWGDVASAVGQGLETAADVISPIWTQLVLIWLMTGQHPADQITTGLSATADAASSIWGKVKSLFSHSKGDPIQKAKQVYDNLNPQEKADLAQKAKDPAVIRKAEMVKRQMGQQQAPPHVQAYFRGQK